MCFLLSRRSRWATFSFPDQARLHQKYPAEPWSGFARSGPGIAAASPAYMPRMDGIEPMGETTSKSEKKRSKKYGSLPNQNGEIRSDDTAQQQVTMAASCQRIPPMPHNDSERKHRFQHAEVMQAVAPRRNPLLSPSCLWKKETISTLHHGDWSGLRLHIGGFEWSAGLGGFTDGSGDGMLGTK